jgi:hypothetical protein
MAEMKELFGNHKVIALDSCVWIYHLEKHPEYTSLIRQVFEPAFSRRSEKQSAWWQAGSLSPLKFDLENKLCRGNLR